MQGNPSSPYHQRPRKKVIARERTVTELVPSEADETHLIPSPSEQPAYFPHRHPQQQQPQPHIPSGSTMPSTAPNASSPTLVNMLPNAPNRPIPGKNDLEVLERLKAQIKSGNHDTFAPVPQPAALASLYLGRGQSPAELEPKRTDQPSESPPPAQSAPGVRDSRSRYDSDRPDYSDFPHRDNRPLSPVPRGRDLPPPLPSGDRYIPPVAHHTPDVPAYERDHREHDNRDHTHRDHDYPTRQRDFRPFNSADRASRDHRYDSNFDRPLLPPPPGTGDRYPPLSQDHPLYDRDRPYHRGDSRDRHIPLSSAAPPRRDPRDDYRDRDVPPRQSNRYSPPLPRQPSPPLPSQDRYGDGRTGFVDDRDRYPISDRGPVSNAHRSDDLRERDARERYDRALPPASYRDDRGLDRATPLQSSPSDNTTNRQSSSGNVTPAQRRPGQSEVALRALEKRAIEASSSTHGSSSPASKTLEERLSSTTAAGTKLQDRLAPAPEGAIAVAPSGRVIKTDPDGSAPHVVGTNVRDVGSEGENLPRKHTPESPSSTRGDTGLIHNPKTGSLEARLSDTRMGSNSAPSPMHADVNLGDSPRLKSTSRFPPYNSAGANRHHHTTRVPYNQPSGDRYIPGPPASSQPAVPPAPPGSNTYRPGEYSNDGRGRHEGPGWDYRDRTRERDMRYDGNMGPTASLDRDRVRERYHPSTVAPRRDNRERDGGRDPAPAWQYEYDRALEDDDRGRVAPPSNGNYPALDRGSGYTSTGVGYDRDRNRDRDRDDERSRERMAFRPSGVYDLRGPPPVASSGISSRVAEVPPPTNYRRDGDYRGGRYDPYLSSGAPVAGVRRGRSPSPPFQGYRERDEHPAVKRPRPRSPDLPDRTPNYYSHGGGRVGYYANNSGNGGYASGYERNRDPHEPSLGPYGTRRDGGDREDGWDRERHRERDMGYEGVGHRGLGGRY